MTLDRQVYCLPGVTRPALQTLALVERSSINVAHCDYFQICEGSDLQYEFTSVARIAVQTPGQGRRIGYRGHHHQGHHTGQTQQDRQDRADLLVQREAVM